MKKYNYEYYVVFQFEEDYYFARPKGTEWQKRIYKENKNLFKENGFTIDNIVDLRRAILGEDVLYSLPYNRAKGLPEFKNKKQIDVKVKISGPNSIIEKEEVKITERGIEITSKVDPEVLFFLWEKKGYPEELILWGDEKCK